MEVRDSRRLTGPNLLLDGAGVVLDVLLPADRAEAAVNAWRSQVERMLSAVDWGPHVLADRIYPSGVSLAFSGPVDRLYAGAEVNEWAWAAAELVLAGKSEPDLEPDATRLRNEIAEESNPAMLALEAAARERGVPFLWCDDFVSLGYGKHSQTWTPREVPAVDEVEWERFGPVPIAVITGTNGKSTTVRLLAAMTRAAGLVEGLSSTDWIRVGDEIVDEDDWSGPGGARTVLRDTRVEVALLETARGVMLRRGLGVESCDVAAVLNVAADHLGEWGVEDLGMLADTKMLVQKIGQRLVLNADDPEIVARAPGNARITWFSIEPSNPVLQEDDEALVFEDDALWRWRDGDRVRLAGLDEVPVTLGGAARHNVANALAAAAVGFGLGLSQAHVVAGLKAFVGSPSENPGRGNLFDLGGVKVLVDFAHNPHGFRAIFDMARKLGSERWAVLLGQAGDRRDEDIVELTRLTWEAGPDLVVVKDMEKYLRGREPGAVPAMIAAELKAAGAPDDAIIVSDSEMDAVRAALGWARPGDLLLLLSHADRADLLGLLETLQREQWAPGAEIPA